MGNFFTKEKPPVGGSVGLVPHVPGNSPKPVSAMDERAVPYGPRIADSVSALDGWAVLGWEEQGDGLL